MSSSNNSTSFQQDLRRSERFQNRQPTCSSDDSLLGMSSTTSQVSPIAAIPSFDARLPASTNILTQPPVPARTSTPHDAPTSQMATPLQPATTLATPNAPSLQLATPPQPATALATPNAPSLQLAQPQPHAAAAALQQPPQPPAIIPPVINNVTNTTNNYYTTTAAPLAPTTATPPLPVAPTVRSQPNDVLGPAFRMDDQRGISQFRPASPNNTDFTSMFPFRLQGTLYRDDHHGSVPTSQCFTATDWTSLHTFLGENVRLRPDGSRIVLMEIPETSFLEDLGHAFPSTDISYSLPQLQKVTLAHSPEIACAPPMRTFIMSSHTSSDSWARGRIIRQS